MVAQLNNHEIGELLDLDAIRTELATRHLRHFVKQAWKIVEPATEYRHNWHIDALCDHLEATIPQGSPATHKVTPGLIRDLLVTMPPRAMKSLIISVFFPAWVWIDHPEIRFLYASYAQGLATDHSQLTRMVIESDWYQARWGDRFQLADDDNLKTRFSNTARGQRIATSVGSAVTGFGGDYVICDDPHNVQQVESASVREAAVRWWNKSMSTRRNNPATSVRIVVMQRVHESDVAGSCIESGEYVHLNLPQEFEGDAPESPIGWKDPRTELSELLWPERMTPQYIASQKKDLGSTDYAAQHQQRPQPAEGGMFKRHWWRYWRPRDLDLPPVKVQFPDGTTIEIEAVEQPAWWDLQAQSWDMTFKETKSGSYVVGLVGAIHGSGIYLLDRFRERTDFPGTIQAILDMTNDWPDATAKYVEEKANGAAAIATLKDRVPGLIAVQTDGGKESRANAATPFVEAGNVFLPHPLLAPWVREFIDEFAAFPTGTHDDQVDTFSQLTRRIAPEMSIPEDIDQYFSWQAP